MHTRNNTYIYIYIYIYSVAPAGRRGGPAARPRARRVPAGPRPPHLNKFSS